MHRYWQCPGLSGSAEPLIEKSQHLAAVAAASAETEACFWLRGLTPRHWRPCDGGTFGGERFLYNIAEPTIEGTKPWDCGRLAGLGIRLYSDGSGGPNASDSMLRRCAWSVIALKGGKPLGNSLPFQEWDLVAAWGAPLEGKRQSANRAELAAFLSAAKATVGDGTIGGDNQEVIDGFWDGRWGRQEHGPNQDLWHELGRAILARPGTLRPYKVKGVHADDGSDRAALLQGTISAPDFFGNLYADRTAAAVARGCQISSANADQHREISNLESLVQGRLAAAGLRQATEPRKRQDTPEVPVGQNAGERADRRLAALIAASGHTFRLHQRHGAT